MSEAGPHREWRFYVEDVVAFCGKVLAYTKGVDDDTVWSIVRDDVASLHVALITLLAARR